jgi:hypothetical protein
MSKGCRGIKLHPIKSVEEIMNAYRCGNKYDDLIRLLK